MDDIYLNSVIERLTTVHQQGRPHLKMTKQTERKKVSHLLDDNLLCLVQGGVTDHLKIVILIL